MRGINRSGRKWETVGRAAARQHGVVSRSQLRELGVTNSSIEKAVSGGYLHPAFRGTFGVGHSVSDSHAHMMSAVLACGRGAVVSHLTATHLLGLRDQLPVSVEVIAPSASGREIDGIRRHHVPLPRKVETGHCKAIPCTSPSRTIVDLAGMLGERSLRRVVERAAVLRILDIPAIEHSLALRRRRGAPILRAILREWHLATPDPPATGKVPTPPVLRSPLEARLLALIAASELPRPVCNQEIKNGSERLEVDFLWPEQRLVVETDGERFHDNPRAFERDRKRDRVLQLRGYNVVRFTYTQIEKEPDAVVSAIRRLLAADFE
jgi:hypothetical protein